MVIGFANGVFDRLHDGQKHFLRECLMNCDQLTVAIDSDALAQESKGFGVQHWTTRKNALYDFCDALDVRMFHSQEELLYIMRHRKPAVIFKGEDYFGKPVTGGDLARIHWVARHPGYSSTIERMKKLHPEPIAAEDM